MTKYLVLLFTTFGMNMKFSFAETSQVNPPQVSKACQSAIYSFVRPYLSKKQWSQNMVRHVDKYDDQGLIKILSDSIVDFDVAKDMGKQNYCVKAGQVEVKYNGDKCTVIRIISIDNDAQFDCG